MRTLLSLLLLLMATGPAAAHEAGLATVMLSRNGERITLEIGFARRDLAPLAASLEDFRRLLEGAIELRDGGVALPPKSIEITLDQDSVLGHIEYAGAKGPVRFEAPILARMPRGQRMLLGGVVGGERVLDARSGGVEVEVSEHATRRTVPRFLALGVEHILTGWDHLLFLLGLLLAGGGLRRAVGVITAFTLAHSVTLALAAFEIVRVSPSIVEPVIAVSIAWVGIENLLRRPLAWRPALAFGFGLVHGLGFASALADSGLGAPGDALWALVAFNGGVEAGQLAIALVVVPLLVLAQRRAVLFAPAARVASLAVVACGAFWLVERTLG